MKGLISMLQSLKTLFRYAKERFSKRTYFIFTLILWIATTLFPSEPILVSHTPYQYQYGIFSNWITFYQPVSYGREPFWFHLSHGNEGILISPQMILLDSFICYFFYLLLAAAVAAYLNDDTFLKFRKT